MNIDNGFGAGYVASLINRLSDVMPLLVPAALAAWTLFYTRSTGLRMAGSVAADVRDCGRCRYRSSQRIHGH